MEKAELDKRFKKLKSQELEGKLFSQKEEWIKANPEKAKAMREAEGEDWGDDWEDDSIRELKQIFQVW